MRRRGNSLEEALDRSASLLVRHGDEERGASILTGLRVDELVGIERVKSRLVALR